ncbi:MAG TPA: hypothetical protein VG900_15220 [Hyphomicrobiaceae bacterium]|jgi:hypothetical protein|nr:hypothetical protein [Hyphomicrobiaceae bacterium]
MPYCFAEGDPGWDDLGPDDPPSVTQFYYLPPPEVGGAPEPVRFSDTPPPDPESAAPGPAVASRPGILDRLFGRATKPKPVSAWEERQRQEAVRSAQRVAHLTQALRSVGVRRAYCRYDGGNDEGFAWLDHMELTSGEPLSAQEVADRLAQTHVLERLREAKLMPGSQGDDARDLLAIARDAFAIETSVMLLGQGYGTGPYWLYGAFTVDLDACTIVDDRQAKPIVENIQLQT